MTAVPEPRLGIYREGDLISARSARRLHARARLGGWRLVPLRTGERNGGPVWGFRLERAR